MNPMLLADFYKLNHRVQYPTGTQNVYSTWTPRASLLEGVTEVVSFGQQAFIKKYLIKFFNDNFFNRPKETVVAEYKRIVKNTLGVQEPDSQHIEDLWDLRYLPISIKALPEGTLVPLRVPMLTITNTDKRFAWLTNYIETLASCEMWQASTSATVAHEYRKILTKYAELTGGDLGFVDFQGHDFSFRGLSSLDSAVSSGMGHLLSFSGTDTIPAIMGLEQYYNANVEKELVGTSIPATEHSVMCSNGQDEKATFKRLLTEIYPTGFISVVSDTWDFWNTVAIILPELKDIIMAREGKLVIRPDSGDPVKIVCGDKDSDIAIVKKGLVEALWDIFGGTVNSKGFKVLDSHIGAIYGDAITRSRCEQISQKLMDKGFASTNMVYGIGSYTYQYNTRDTFGFALKSTLVTINGDEKQIFKDPKTDKGTKKSQKGAVAVLQTEAGLTYVDGLYSTDVVSGDMLVEVFRDGKILVDQSLSEIRYRLKGNKSIVT